MKKIALFLMLSLLVQKGNAELVRNHLALNQLVFEIRDPQTDLKNFRASLEKIGEYLALELLEELHSKEVKIKTLTGSMATHLLCDEKPVLITILRAGIPLYLGVQKIFPDSESGFLGMSRNEDTLQANLEYIAVPELKNKTVILVDTMIATGGSMLDAIRIIEKKGPKRIFVIGAIASQQGIKRISEDYPKIKMFTAAIDPSLNNQGYIIPGLGDAGDRSFGKKQ